MDTSTFDPDLLARLRQREPLLWLNPRLGQSLPPGAPSPDLIGLAEARLERCAPLLATLFPELHASDGEIESALQGAAALAHAFGAPQDSSAAWFLKRDDLLPVAGSIKARGGFHEVLARAEALAIEQDVLAPDGDRRDLALPAARALFARHTMAVGSTGNLGLSIGVLAATLGFDTVVHMSAGAKEWKKQRLRERGVKVVEHAGDYAAAVAAGRAQAAASPSSHFVDDERSTLLFFGYAVAARELARQLAAAGRVVDAAHPLFVYIPCGVGGAPGGIAFGLKAEFGAHVHCFFAEPLAAPCMLVQLASGSDVPVSVYDIGLDNRTEADGLACALASPFVSPLMAAQLAGAFTVADERLFEHLRTLYATLAIQAEPSATAALDGPGWLRDSAAGQNYVARHGLDMNAATHVIWLTGGSLVPQEEWEGFLRNTTAQSG